MEKMTEPAVFDIISVPHTSREASATSVKPRLAIVASHVIQYQAPLFQRLAASGEVDLTVLYCTSAGSDTYQDRDMKTTLAWDLPLLSGYHHETLRNYSPLGSLNGWGLVNLNLPARLIKGDFDAVVFMGWGIVSYWLGFAACLSRRIPFFLYGDSNQIPPTHSIRQRFRDWVIRTLFRKAAGFLVSGRYNEDYYRHYGADNTRFFSVPWAVDNDRFEQESRLTEAERNELRAAYGISPDALVIVFSGKLLPRKGPMDLLEAYADLPNRDRAVLLLLGEGVERERLEAFCSNHALKNVRITGFLNQSILPRMYGISDVFALPSYFDPRATVVNEAMAAGLACVVSDCIGPSGDIVRDGENGFVVPAGDISALRSSLNRFLEEPALARRMGDKSREIIGRWSYREDVDGIVAAARFARSLGELRRARG
jgi:glycosyltransferase involved in cell wall biosynthesis